MKLIPHLYLKEGQTFCPVPSKPGWFKGDPAAMVAHFLSQRIEGLFISDLDVPNQGESPNFKAIQSLCDDTNLQLWVWGNFKTLESIERYDTAGVNKIVVGVAAYQHPNFFLEALQKFGKSISTKIDCKSGKVLIPGMVAPSHKAALDYAARFQEDGITALCYSDVSSQEQLTYEEYKRTKAFCNGVSVPVLCTSEVTRIEDLEGLFHAESSGLAGIVIGKAMYNEAIDLRSAQARLNDLAVTPSFEETFMENE